MIFELHSPAFGDGDIMSERYTREGGNFSPPLRWSGAPRATQSYALIVESPDTQGGVVRHWALYDIPAEFLALEENIGRGRTELASQAINDFGAARYDGPRTLMGEQHNRYRFRLFALPAPLVLPQDATAADLLAAVENRALDEARLLALC